MIIFDKMQIRVLLREEKSGLLTNFPRFFTKALLTGAIISSDIEGNCRGEEGGNNRSKDDKIPCPKKWDKGKYDYGLYKDRILGSRLSQQGPAMRG
jgi:hypothetical protein